jgi:hypothetical protein
MTKYALFAGLLLTVSPSSAWSSEAAPALAPPPVPGELLFSGAAKDVEAARPGLASRGFVVREVGRAEGKLTIALTPPRGDEKALGTLFKDMMCGRLAGVKPENLGFVGNEMDPSAKQPVTKFILYGSPQTVSRVVGEARRRGWTVGSMAPSGDGRSFTTLATSSTMTQGAYSAFLDTLFSWKLTDASVAEVQDGKLFRSYEGD